MNLEQEFGNREDFKKHLTLFIVAHIIVNIWLRMDVDFLSGLKESITQGRIWYYHEQTGLFITVIWFLFLAVQGVYTGLKRKRKEVER
ncbi:hypothetical protein [Aureibacillus halotolerans]|uniref:2TM domain-containing protein n=1 Tax=Aureibacillus halotolerans TaxID=1508390 RepID=A0A4R6U693_9BACI|nr:hypothetical protein [Aureibacillus halotolerans]TDQ40383.1 hypothetical protein EV213_10699 [Aureibacillus halotolerans]